MSSSHYGNQQGVISLLVISITSIVLLAFVLIAAFGQIGPFICLLARALGLPSLR